MKNYQQLLLSGLLLLIGNILCAQISNDTLDINGHADCTTRLSIETRKTIGPTTSPNGYGEVLEFSRNDSKSLHFMERENHTVWYEFETKTGGHLTFEIEPLDSLNDYDFALYKYTDDNFCADVRNKTILPIRTNFSRNKPAIGSRTGLDMESEEMLVTSGINAAYAQSVVVKPKEKYVLLVNNVYGNGKGHWLHFDYSINMELTGQVVQVDGAGSLDANITLTNTKTGLVIAETTADSMTGAYQLMFDLPKSQMNDLLHLEVSKEGYFFYDTLMTAFKIKTKMRNIQLKTPIRRLKKGTKFVVSNILFYGGSPKPLPKSMPTLKALYKMMQRNKKLKIKIEGHTNGCLDGEVFSQELSDARAATVATFLIDYKINPKRLDSVGYGCKRMLHDIHGKFAYLNRRVEIEIVSF